MPAFAGASVLRLSNASVSPRTANEGATLTVSVTYKNVRGTPAASVVVKIGDHTYPLAPAKGKRNVNAGVKYSAKVKAASRVGGGHVPRDRPEGSQGVARRRLDHDRCRHADRWVGLRLRQR